MAVSSIDSRTLQLQISASSELLIRNLRQADVEIDRFRRETDGNLDRIDRRFADVGKPLAGLRERLASAAGGGFAGFFAGALGGVGFAALAKGGLDYASSLAEVAQQLGVTARDLQVFRYAASQTGIAQEAMDKGLAKLTQTMGRAAVGADAPIKAFAAIGISLADLKGKTAGDVLPLIAEGLKGVTSPAQRAAVEIALFGKAGQQLDTLLAGGRGQIDELASSAQSLGLVLSDKQIQDADQLADKLSELKQQLEARIAGVVADNSQSIFQLATSLASLTGEIIKFLSVNPGRALAIISGLAGLAVGGPIVAAAGVVTGYLYGENERLKGEDASKDLKFRQQKYREARATYETAKRNPAGASEDDQVAAERGGAVARGGIDLAAATREVYRQRDLLNAAFIESRKPKPAPPKTVASPGADLPKFLAGGGGSTPKGKSAQQLAEEAARNEKSYTSDEQRAQDQLASLREQLTAAAQDRYDIEVDRIAAAKTARDKEIEESAKLNPVIAAHVEHLQALNDETAEAKKKIALARRDTQLAQDALNLRLVGYDDQRTAAELQSALALTTAQRRDAEKRLLDIAIREERDRLEGEKSDALANGDKARADVAQARLNGLPDRANAQRAIIDKRNQGPMASYFDSLRASVGDAAAIKESLESIEVHGIEALTDTLGDGVAKALHLKGIAGEIVSELAKLAIKKGVLSAAGGFGSFFSSLFGGGKATGGDVDGSKFYLVGEKGPELFAPGRSGTIITNEALRAPSLPSPARLAQMSNNGGMAIKLGDIHLSAPGADPAQLARLEQAFAQSQRDLPAKVVEHVADARSRMILRGTG